MKRILVAALLLMAISVSIYAAAPTHRHYTKVQNSVTVDNQWSDTTWDIVDSAIVVASDSALVIMRITGVAVMDPGDKLYIGFSFGEPASAPSLDTAILNPRVRRLGTQRHSFSFTAAISDSTILSTFYNGGATDTLFILAAAGGGGITEAVTLEDVVLEWIVTDNNDAQDANIDQ